MTNVQDVTGYRSLTPQVHVEDPTAPSTDDRAVQAPNMSFGRARTGRRGGLPEIRRLPF